MYCEYSDWVRAQKQPITWAAGIPSIHEKQLNTNRGGVVTPKIHIHLDSVFFRQTHGRRKIGHFYLVTWKQGGELSCSPPAKWKPCRALWNPFLWGEMDGWKAHYNPIAKLQHCPCQFGTVSGLEVHGMLLWSIASLPTVTAVGCNFRF